MSSKKQKVLIESMAPGTTKIIQMAVQSNEGLCDWKKILNWKIWNEIFHNDILSSINKKAIKFQCEKEKTFAVQLFHTDFIAISTSEKVGKITRYFDLKPCKSFITCVK